ncbi:hypothetical protein, partial [Methanoregula sp.]|uniref:hypothetical protein n=1 Tax=Methanoregula sp. TaxID=2052170 RepID=UPI0025FA77AF
GKRGGGRPKAIKIQKAPAMGEIQGSRQDAERAPPAPLAGTGGEKYTCDGCGAEVRYGQRKCPKCGIWNDWRGTAVEMDPDLVVCPECGAIAGHTDTAAKCPHCNYLG